MLEYQSWKQQTVMRCLPNIRKYLWVEESKRPSFQARGSADPYRERSIVGEKVSCQIVPLSRWVQAWVDKHWERSHLMRTRELAAWSES